MLTAFVTVLTLLSSIDLAEGRVDLMRVLSHLLVVAGLGLVMLLDRIRTGGGGSNPAQRHPRGRLLGGGDASADLAPLADEHHSDLRPTARHHAA